MNEQSELKRLLVETTRSFEQDGDNIKHLEIAAADRTKRVEEIKGYIKEKENEIYNLQVILLPFNLI